ncbi:outer membrane beta-barrel protein [Hymenobacter sp. B81]|uniref:outer membrane beta-barrel protein n=1 Tax=Hymenobacter sp. B81 TaxID=3344878 RepID=UPI0037DD99F0
MRYQYLLFGLLTGLLGLLAALSAQAQPPAARTAGKATLTGTVLDSASGQPLREASVSLLAARDSSYVMFSITDGDGKFALRNVAPGRYYLLLTFLGYRNRLPPVLVAAGQPTVAVGELRLRAQSHTLGEVIIQQERAPVSLQGDTLAFSARAFKTQPNAAVESLLKKLPGVEVDRDGTIRAQGQAVNRVLVDGKPFFGDDPRMATRNLPADIIDQVQLFNQQSDQAAFNGIDDGQQQRTINLVTKRDKRKGYFGQNSVAAGTDGRYQTRLGVNRFNNGRQLSALGMANNVNQQGFADNGGPAADNGPAPGMLGGPGGGGGMVMRAPGERRNAPAANQPASSISESAALGLNYRDAWGKRTEVATSYLASRNTVVTDQQSRRETVAPPGAPGEAVQPLVTAQDAYDRTRTSSHRFNLRLDYRLDSLTSLRATPYLSWQTTAPQRRLSQQASVGAQLLNQGQSQYRGTDRSWAGAGSLLLMRKFRRDGRSISANLSPSLSDQTAEARNEATNAFFGPDGSATTRGLHQQLDQQAEGRSYQLNLAYTEPLSLRSKLELRASHRQNGNYANRAVRDYNDATGRFEELNPVLSNRFRGDFVAQRAGLTLQTRRLRYTYSLGFDAQQTTLRVRNYSADTLLSRRFTHLLPNALLTYNGSRNRSLRLNYRSRLTAPTTEQLQPVADNSNPLNVQLGNPALRPERSHNLVATYNQFNARNNRSVFLLLNALQVQDRIAAATTIGAGGAQTTRPVNADGYRNLTGFLSLGQRLPARQLNLNLTSNGSYSQGPSFVNGQANETRSWTLGQGASVNSTFNEKLEFGLSANVSYQAVRYALLPAQNAAFLSQTLTADVYYHLTPRLIISSDLWYRRNTGRAAGFNQPVALWNLALARQLFRNQQGELKVQAYDLLGQNRSLVRNVTDTYLEDVRSRVLTRYFLLSFSYQLRRFGV